MIMVLCKMTKDRGNILVETSHFPVNHGVIRENTIWWKPSPKSLMELEFFSPAGKGTFLRIALHLWMSCEFLEVDSKPQSPKGPFFRFAIHHRDPMMSHGVTSRKLWEFFGRCWQRWHSSSRYTDRRGPFDRKVGSCEEAKFPERFLG